MGMTKARLTVFFEEPFYVALYERTQDGYTQVCRVVFGKEPTDTVRPDRALSIVV